MNLSLSGMLIYFLMRIFLTEVKVQNKTQTILGKPVKKMADTVRVMMKEILSCVLEYSRESNTQVKFAHDMRVE